MMKTNFNKSSVCLILSFILFGCHDERVVPVSEHSTESASENWRGGPYQLDPFADFVVEAGVPDDGQCCQDPASLIGPWPLLEAGAGEFQLGTNGYVVMDMGAGEEIVADKGPDLMVIEFDGTLLGGGVDGLAETYSVWASNVPAGPFVKLGEATGTGFFELGDSGLPGARYLKIQDEGGVVSNGADPHALVALNMAGARFEMVPHTILRGQKSPIMARFRMKEHIKVASVSIVVVAGIGQLPATDDFPYTTDLSIEGKIGRDGKYIQFKRSEFLASAPDGENLVVALKIITRSGEVRYLFDLVNVVSPGAI